MKTCALLLAGFLLASPAWAEDAGLSGKGEAQAFPSPVATGLVITPFDLFNHVPATPEEARGYYEILAGRGNLYAQMNLAFMLAEGTQIPQNLGQARFWFEKAAMQGDALAQLDLAIMLEKGLGTPRDLETAQAWYEKAARKGQPQAQVAVGQRLEVQDPPACEEAAKWYEKSARQGHAPGKLALGKLYERGCGVRQDKLKAKGIFEDAVEDGLPEAAYALALYYRNEGEEALNISGQDLMQARKWLLIARRLWGTDEKGLFRGSFVLAYVTAFLTESEIVTANAQADSWLVAHGFSCVGMSPDK